VTYTFSFAPGLSGLFGNVTTAKLEGQFLTRADNAIRDFNIIARNSAGSSHAVTASWRNPVTPVNFFRLTAKLSETFSFDSAEAAQTLTVAYSANVAKMTTGFVLSDAGGKNLLVEIEGCNGTPASATCVSTATAETYGLLASAPAASAATETFISKASSTVVSVALEVKENKTVPPVTVKVAPSALPFSTAVAVSEIPATQKTALLAKPGVTSRVAAPMQFGPDGLVFEEPVDVAISFDPQEVIAGTPSASALLEKMQGLVYLPEQGRWMAKGIAKSRVELVGNNEALLWLRVPHFSVISASVALAFASANSSLVELRADDTTSVTLSWDKTVQTSSVRYALSNPNQAVRQTNFTTNADSVVIYVSGQSMGLATYTVEVCDDAVNDCASTPGAWISTSLTFNVVSEDADNTSLPLRDVTTFAVYLTSNGTAANLSWEIPAADKVVGSKTIQDVEIAYRPLDQAAGTEIVLSINRAVETTAITGLTAGKAYVWRLRTRNASQVYSTDAEYRFTAGTVESAVTDGNVSSLSGGVRVVANSAALLTNLASVGILDSTTTFKVGGTTLEIKGNGLVDLNFSSTTSASAKITLNTTGSNLVVYHYRLSPTNGVGAWRELPTQNDASAAKYVYYTKNALETEFTVYSRGGEGSPFAVAPKIVSPVVYRSGGGGGCSVAGNCCDEEHAGSWINFLLMLMPLGYLLLRKFK
jgi:predicted secreted protein